MKLCDEGSGDYLSLALVGYEFAEVTDEWDSNWLRVQVEVSLNGRSWTTVAPCLDTYNVRDLADWLQQVADGVVSTQRLGFTEPSLTFEFVDGDASRIRLRIWLEMEARPPWAKKGFVGEPDLAVSLTLAPESARSAARELLEQLERFPTRVRHPLRHPQR